MPQPTPSAVHVNRPLTNISIAFIQNAVGFVADQVFPNVPVPKQSDRYFRYDRSDFFRNQMRRRAPSTESAGSGWKVDSTPTYFAHVWALHKDIDDQVRANQDDPLNMDRDASIWLSQQALINREAQWATNYFTTGIWTGTTSGTDVIGTAASPVGNDSLQWNDNNSDPISEIKKYADQQWLKTAYRPNMLIMGRQVWTRVSEHPDLIARIQYGATNVNPTILSRQAAAALFEVEKLLVMDGIQVTAPETMTFESPPIAGVAIGGKHALLAYAAPAPSLMMPSGGYTFSWTGYLPNQGPQGQVVSSFRMQELKSDRVEMEMAFDQKLVCSDCGTFFSNIVA